MSEGVSEVMVMASGGFGKLWDGFESQAWFVDFGHLVGCEMGGVTGVSKQGVWRDYVWLAWEQGE